VCVERWWVRRQADRVSINMRVWIDQGYGYGGVATAVAASKRALRLAEMIEVEGGMV